MSLIAKLLGLALVFVPLASGTAAAGTLPEGFGEAPVHHAEDPSAPPVTAANLMANDRFWPYHVGVDGGWKPEGRETALPEGISGVLIRLESPELARIDFGRDGLYEVPVDRTDLLERANRIPRGELDKMAPNFLLTVGPRLVDPSADSLRPMSFSSVSERAGFLCVFADPSEASFAAIAEALAPLQDRHGVMTVLFAQGDHPDGPLAEQLRKASWTVPFLYDHLADPYTRALLRDGSELPWIQLVTREGRILVDGPWSEGLVSTLAAALEREFGGAAAASAPSSPEQEPEPAPGS